MIRFLTLFVFCLLSWFAHADADEGQVFDLDSLQAFDGSMIHEIHIHGLRWTKERAVRWLLTQHEGDAFAAKVWVKGIHKLYDTRVLYHIYTSVRPLPDHTIDLEIMLTDRWTLLPYGVAQA